MRVSNIRALGAPRHLPLILLLGLAAILASIAVASAVEGENVWLSPEAAHQAAAEGSIVLIDLRSPGEWDATGVPEHARLISIHDSDGIAGFGEKVLAAVDGDRNRPIAVICARGYRSARARNYLSSIGFNRVLDVREGMLGREEGQGWLARGLPVRSCDAC